MARLKVTGAPEFILIDKDTGTVLGNNVVAVWVAGKFSEEYLDEVSSSDSAAFELAEKYGENIYTL